MNLPRPSARPPLARLLVATDFSATSGRALLFSVRLPGKGRRVRLLHVLELGPHGVLAALPAAEEQARAWLEREARALRRRGISCAPRLVWGSPESEIAREAREFDASAIVCGTHGRRGVVRFLLGSVAERLLQISRVPLLLVPHVSLRRKVRRILVATDFSPASTAAFALAGSLCRSGAGELLAIHAFDSGFSRASAFSAHPGFFEEVRRRREETGKNLAELRRTLSLAGIRNEVRLEEGDPAERILRAADRWDPDLIAMGTRGRRGLPRFILGSVARRVLRGTPCPILAVPPP